MDAYGTFEPRRGDAVPPPRSASRALPRAVGAAGVVMLALAAFSSQFSSYESDPIVNDSLSTAASVSGLSDAEREFLSGISRDRMKEFLHAYSR